MWTNTCTQSLNTDGANCNASPTYVDAYLNTALLTGAGDTVTNAIAGGF
jgi:hypothetical protein